MEMDVRLDGVEGVRASCLMSGAGQMKNTLSPQYDDYGVTIKMQIPRLYSLAALLRFASG
jgi:hypothetical protein